MVWKIKERKTWSSKQSICPPKDEWIKDMWYIHTMEYYSALEKKESVPQATACMKLEDIMLNEIRQSQKDKYCTIPLTWDI